MRSVRICRRLARERESRRRWREHGAGAVVCRGETAVCPLRSSAVGWRHLGAMQGGAQHDASL